MRLIYAYELRWFYPVFHKMKYKLLFSFTEMLAALMAVCCSRAYLVGDYAGL